MFCAMCGKELPSDLAACPACGALRQPGGSVPKTSVDVAAVAADTRGALAEILRDPVAGLPKFFNKLARRRALEVGIAVALVGTLLVVVGVFMAVPSWARPSNAFFGILLMAVVMFGGLTGSGYAARQVLHGEGSVEGDVFVAAVSLAPISVLVFFAGLVGMGNVELIGAVAMFAFSWTVLMLYSGVTAVSGISERKGPYAVPLMLMLTFWLTSVVTRAIL